MIFILVQDNIINYYNEKGSFIKDKCVEHNCPLNSLNKHNYLILDGDKIEEELHSNQNKSVDCIIFKKNTDTNAEIKNVLLCELTSGSKRFEDLEEKFINSSKEIINCFNNLNMEGLKLKFLFLGKLKDSGQIVNMANSIKKYNKPLKVPNYFHTDTEIIYGNCRDSIDDFNIF